MSAFDFAIDTTAAVAIMNREPGIGRRLGGRANLHVPVTVLGELYFGAEKSARVAENIARVEYLLQRVTTTAREYGRLNQLLRAKGKPLPQNDVWIAAAAIQHQLPLVTQDTHFEQIDGLTLINW